MERFINMLRRLVFILLLWLPIANIIITTLILLLPCWIIFGKIAYELPYFLGINNWHWKLKSNNKQTK